MRSSTDGRVTGLAVLASTALVAGGAVLMSGPATATSAPLTYACSVATVPNVGTFNYDLTVIWDTDAPDSFTEGTTVDTVKATGSANVDPDAIDQLQTLGADHVAGGASVPMTVNGGAWDRSMTVTSGTVPPVDGVPMTVSLESAADGVLPSNGPGNQIPIGSGSSFIANLTARNASDQQVGPALNFTCNLSPGDQNQSVDVVSVLASTPTAPPTSPTGPTGPTSTGSSSSTATSTGTATPTSGPTTSPAAKADTTTTAGATYRDAKQKLVAKAKVVADVGGAVTGEAKFVLKRNGVRLKTARVDLDDAGRAKKVFKNITQPGKYLVVAKYLGSATLARSKDTDKVVV